MTGLITLLLRTLQPLLHLTRSQVSPQVRGTTGNGVAVSC